MKKHIITAIVLACLIVPTQAAFAGNRGHEDNFLAQLVEMSIFPHRYIIPAIKPHGDNGRYDQHHNRTRYNGHHNRTRYDGHYNYRPDNRYNSRKGDYDSYNDRKHDRRRDHNRGNKRGNDRGNDRNGHGRHWE